MTQANVNSTLPVVADKINNILAAYSLYEYRQVFAVPELHQKLTTYVLSHLPVVQVTADSGAASDTSPAGRRCSAEQHDQIDRLIHRGIEALLGHLEAQQGRRNTEPYKAAVSPSWSGQGRASRSREP
ncbi:MAG: hypothetical protein WBG38_07600 [Nodosilinea sp.]